MKQLEKIYLNNLMNTNIHNLYYWKLKVHGFMGLIETGPITRESAWEWLGSLHKYYSCVA